MAIHEPLREALKTLESLIESLKAALPEIEGDRALADSIRKLASAPAPRSDSGTKAAAIPSPRPRKTSKRKAAREKGLKAAPALKPTRKATALANGTLASDEKVHVFIRGQGKGGAKKKDIEKATGLTGEKLRGVLARLRDAHKVAIQGKTNQTRYLSV